MTVTVELAWYDRPTTDIPDDDGAHIERLSEEQALVKALDLDADGVPLIYLAGAIVYRGEADARLTRLRAKRRAVALELCRQETHLVGGTIAECWAKLPEFDQQRYLDRAQRLIDAYTTGR